MLPRPRLRWSSWSWTVGCIAVGCGTTTEPTPKASHPSSYGAEAPPCAAPQPQPSNSVVTAPAPTQTPSAATATPAPTPAPTWNPALANLNPDDDSVVGPPDAIADCEDRLKAAGVTYRTAKLPMAKRGGFVCGSPQVVEYLGGPEHIRFRPRPLVTCQLALALAHFEQVLNRTAQDLLGVKVTSVTQGGTYSCRSMARFKLVSEHSYANAIDLYAFGLSDAKAVSVLKHFGSPKLEAATTEGKFLRTLAQRSFDENVFSVVVTRYFDEIHRDHMHVDMAHYRTDGTR